MVSPLYHPSLGGLGRQAKVLTERLSREGVDLFVITRYLKDVPDATYSPDVEVIRAWSVRPRKYHLPEINLENLLTSLLFSLSTTIKLLQQRNHYEIVHFHGAGLPLIVNLPVLKALRKKVVAKVAAANLGTEAGSLRGRYLGLGTILGHMLKWVDAFIATTGEIRDGLLREGIREERIWRIPNFIDLSLYPPSGSKEAIKRSLGLPEGRIFVFAGRFVKRKGIEYLLRAWAEVLREAPQGVYLLLLGDGPLKAEMVSLSRSLAIEKKTLFLGHVEEVREYLYASDAFVLPSLQEGMPNSLLEAMACSLPVIATRIGGVTDIIEDGVNGILVPPAEVSPLAEAMLRVLSDRDLSVSLASHARRTVEMHFSLDRVVGGYLRLYRALMNTGDGE